MTRVMIAVDGSDLDAPLARTAHRLFGDEADYWAVNVQPVGAAALGAVPATFPAMYGGSLVGFGGAYPIMAADPHRVRDTPAGDADATGDDVVDQAAQRADAMAEAAVDQAGIDDAEHVAVVGDPPEAILRAARDHGIDVIVVGDHDRSWWSRLFAPAVGSELIERAEVPVLVISDAATDRSPIGQVTP
jgi:nucleotide-binding universal stress UspA family protein